MALHLIRTPLTVLAPLDDGRVDKAKEGRALAPRHRLVVPRVRRVVAEGHEEGAPRRVAVLEPRQQPVGLVRLELVGEAAVAVRRDVERVAPWREFRQWIIVELSVD